MSRTAASVRLLVLTAALVSALSLGACDDDDDTVTGSGTIEATTLSVTSGTGGRVLESYAAEGDTVGLGDPLMRLDPVLITAALDEARAGQSMAELHLEQVKAGARPEEVRAAEAELAQAMAAWDGARRAWTSAERMLANPRELEDQVAQAETAVALAQTAVAQASGKLSAAAELRDSLPSGGGEQVAADQQIEALQAALGASRAGLAGAESALAQIEDARDNPSALEAMVSRAESAYRQAEAGALAADEALSLKREGPTLSQVDAADAALAQAAAGVEGLEAARDELTLRAPITGTVMTISASKGELAAPGSALARVADLDEVEITIYVPETRIADLHVGQTAEVDVDAFEDETFEGELVHIASEAEFTPRNVQTEDQRANLVFAVRVRLDNADQKLRPGMPAVVTIDAS